MNTIQNLFTALFTSLGYLPISQCFGYKLYINILKKTVLETFIIGTSIVMENVKTN